MLAWFLPPTVCASIGLRPDRGGMVDGRNEADTIERILRKQGPDKI